MKMIIDATNLILGRIATISAKRALMGENVDIINCEDAVITGSKKNVIGKSRQRAERGIPTKGPFYPKRPDMFVKRSVRGMLPYKQEKGRKAFKRVRCYSGIPDKFIGKKTESIKGADFSKIPIIKYVRVRDICRELKKREN